MSEVQIGERVGVLLSVERGVVNWLGFGTYQGEHPVPAEHAPTPDFVDLPNPKITIDGGTVVWGFECYWGPEAEMRAKYFNGNYTIKPTFIDRSEYSNSTQSSEESSFFQGEAFTKYVQQFKEAVNTAYNKLQQQPN